MGGSHSVNAALGKWIRNVDSALLQFSAKAVGSGILEGAEEGIQTYISDWLKSEITKEDFHTKPTDALYSSLLGFITGTVLDTPDVAADVFLQRDAGEVISPEIQAVEENMTGLGDVRYSDRKNDSGFKDYDITAAVYEIRSEKAERGHDLVKIGTMPSLYQNLFGLSGDVYVSNSHMYQNMVSRSVAEAEGRFDIENHADYHELGEEKLINAIEQFQDPLILMESLKDFNETRLVAVLDEKGNDGQNLIAVMELYAPIAYPGSNQRRNHVLMTIYEKTACPITSRRLLKRVGSCI